jgi:hypothetical protein
MRWAVEFDDDDGLWLRSTSTTTTLAVHGYAVGAFVDEKTGVRTYTLHRRDDRTYPIIYETDSLEQLNGYINLLLPPREGV